MDKDFKQLIANCFHNHCHGDHSAMNLLYFEIEKKLLKERENGYKDGFEVASTIALEVIDAHNDNKHLK